MSLHFDPDSQITGTLAVVPTGADSLVNPPLWLLLTVRAQQIMLQACSEPLSFHLVSSLVTTLKTSGNSLYLVLKKTRHCGVFVFCFVYFWNQKE